MKKRLRKKLYLGEFHQDYFPISFTTPSSFSDDDRDKWCDEFIEMIERNGLQCCFGGRNDWEGGVEFCGRGTASEDHRLLVRRWLENHDQVSGVIVGELRDAWHDRR